MFNFFPDIISYRIIFVAGSGKSVLWFVYPFIILSAFSTSSFSSTIIEDIKAMCEDGRASMAYFYFDSRDVNKQHLYNLIPSLLIHLSRHSRPPCDILSRLYKAHDNGKTRPSDSVLIKSLKHMLFNFPDRHPIYLVMDALDESPESPDTSGIPSHRERVIQFVKELNDLRLSNLHICVTSGPEVDIQDILEPLIRVSLDDQSGQKQDIVDYVTSVVRSDSESIMKGWKKQDKNLVIKKLPERANEG